MFGIAGRTIGRSDHHVSFVAPNPALSLTKAPANQSTNNKAFRWHFLGMRLNHHSTQFNFVPSSFTNASRFTR